MNIREGIKSALQNLTGSKMRTFLTMLGMIIGIGSVIMILSIGAGVQDSLTGLFDKFGKGTIQLDAGKAGSEDFFITEDFEVLMDLPGINTATPFMAFMGELRMRKADELKFCEIWGITEDYGKVMPVKLIKGRNISISDNKNKANVAVVEEALATQRFGTTNVIGKQIELRYDNQNYLFEIVGVKEDTYDIAGMPKEHIPLMVYLPYETVMSSMFDYGEGKASMAMVGAKEDANVNELAQNIKKILEKRHNVKNLYNVEPLSKQMGEINAQLGIMMAFISIVAGISLVVGGVGIMNIMLVTVKERTREIGIRKALGAKNKEVLTQFLIEALILTLIGGLIGMVFGYLGGLALGGVIDISPKLTTGMLAFSVGTSSLIGLVFGVYPANQAAKLDPIEALRYE
ncbi:MAG TPA: FtsX-like permease family protein [Epulopiscium sp.]|nr:FtsX-like permease family protein [Candidatus Epulonipiscium sp.]